MALDELGSLAGEGCGEKAFFFGRLAAAHDPRDDRPRALRQIRIGAAQEAEELIEAAGERVVLLVLAQMPFADEARLVAGLLEPFGERDFGERQIGAFDRGVVFVSEPLLVAAGHQPGPRGAALRCADVALGAADTARGEGVYVGRGDVLAAVDREVAKAEVVDEDDEDVGAGGSLCAGWIE